MTQPRDEAMRVLKGPHLPRKHFTIVDRLGLAALALFWPEKLVAAVADAIARVDAETNAEHDENKSA